MWTLVAVANTPVCGAGDTGSIPVRPTTLRDTSSGRRPRFERGSWRFESFSLKSHAHVGQWPVRRAFTSEIAGSIPRMSTISCHHLLSSHGKTQGFEPCNRGSSPRRKTIRLARSMAEHPVEARTIMVRFHGQTPFLMKLIARIFHLGRCPEW
jgi:hypothetical protein